MSIYAAFPEPALHFAASLADYLYQNKILAEYASGRLEERGRWELILNALLSGVLVCLFRPIAATT